MGIEVAKSKEVGHCRKCGAPWSAAVVRRDWADVGKVNGKLIGTCKACQAAPVADPGEALAPARHAGGRPSAAEVAGRESATIMQPLAGRYEVDFIPLDQIVACADNPRFLKRDSAGFTALVETVRNLGIQQPVVVRAHPTQKGMYELRAGSRRLAAARAAGLDVIPAVVRQLTDAQAREITTIENFAREELHPIEEARAVENMEKAGYSLAQIAVRLGMSERWVARRRSLLNLSANWMNAIARGDDPSIKLFTARHFEALAKFPASIQDEWLDNWQHSAMFDTPTEESLEGDLASLMEFLSAAPFDLNDATLDKKAGACTDCPKRSSVNPLLFDPEPVGKHKGRKPTATGDACLDQACWKHKVALTISARAKAIKEDTGKPAVLIGYTYNASKEFKLPKPLLEQMQEPHKFQQVKAGTAGAVAAVHAGGPSAGKTCWVKPAARQTYGGSGPERSKEKADPREAVLKRRRKAIVERLGSMIRQRKATDFPIGPAYVRVALALHLAAEKCRPPITATAFAKAFKKFEVASDEELLAGVLDLVKVDTFHCFNAHNATADDAGLAVIFAEELEIDANEVIEKVNAEFPLPAAKKDGAKKKGGK